MKTIIVFLFFMASGFIAFGQDLSPRADARQGTQRTRIATGRASGEVTGREASALNHEQRHIRRNERRAEADGTVTRREKAKLERKQNRANRHIRRAKNNSIER